jgi:methylated-DNA-[protein]-cysteine S-methyltransferase
MANKVWIGEITDTPLGEIWVACSAAGVTAVNLWGNRTQFEAQVRQLTGHEPVYEPEQVADAARQLRQYLQKERTVFELPIDWSVMKPFQAKAMRAVWAVAYGRLTTYKEIAVEIGQPTAVRAVGRANGTNPMPIIIPCHRVLGADGKLHGYSAPGGLETKAWLLRLEGSWLL